MKAISDRDIAEKVEVSSLSYAPPLQGIMRQAKTTTVLGNYVQKRFRNHRISSSVASLRNRRRTSNEIATQVSEAGEVNVSATTVRRRLIAAGLNCRCAAIKPLLPPVNKCK